MRNCAMALCEEYQSATCKSYHRTEPKDVGDTADVLNNRALSLFDLGKPDEAERLFDRALELDKHHATATYNQGLMLWRAARCTDAFVLMNLQELRNAHPNEGIVECAMGWVRTENADFTQALSNFQKAIELGCESEAQLGLKQVRPMAQAVMDYPRIFEGHTKEVTSVAFSPDGRFALSGSGDEVNSKDHTLRLWDVATGQCLCTFIGHTDSVESVAFSPDGRFVLSGSRDGTLRLWNVATGQCVRTFIGNTWMITSVAYSPDGRLVISGSSDKTLRLWKVSLIMERHYVAPWVYSTVITVEDALERQRSHETHLFQASKALEAGRIAEALVFMKQARAVPGFEKSPESLELQARVGARSRIKSFNGGWYKRTFEGHLHYVHSVAYSPDGCFALSGSADHTLRLWDVITGRCLRIFEGHTDHVRAVAFSPDGRFALSGSFDMTLRLWDVITGRCLYTFEGHKCWVHSVAFSPDGRFVLSGSANNRREGDTIIKDHTLRLWDVATGKCLRTFMEYTDTIKSVAYSPDGRFALSGSENAIRLWDVATGQCLRTFERHTNGVISVAFSPNGRFALSGSENSLQLWDVATGQCLRTFEGHANGVISVAFSPDNHFSLSGNRDNKLRLCDVATGKCLRTFEGHAIGILSVAFSPDGRFVLSGSGDNTIRLWEIDWEYEYDPEHDPMLKHRANNTPC